MKSIYKCVVFFIVVYVGDGVHKMAVVVISRRYFSALSKRKTGLVYASGSLLIRRRGLGV